MSKVSEKRFNPICVLFLQDNTPAHRSLITLQNIYEIDF